MTAKRLANRKDAPDPADPSRMPTRVLVDLTGITERRLRTLASDGRIPIPTAGTWDGREVIRRLCAARIDKFGDTAGDLSMAEAKRQREMHKARREKIQADEAERLVVRVEDASRAITRAAGQVRTRLLAVPAKAAALLESKDVKQRDAVIRQEIDDALAELTRLRLDKRL